MGEASLRNPQNNLKVDSSLRASLSQSCWQLPSSLSERIYVPRTIDSDPLLLDNQFGQVVKVAELALNDLLQPAIPFGLREDGLAVKVAVFREGCLELVGGV